MAAKAEAVKIAGRVKEVGTVEGNVAHLKRRLELPNMTGSVFRSALRTVRYHGVTCREVRRGVFKLSPTR